MSIVIPKEATKMIEGKGRFMNRPTKTGNRVYDKFFIYVPTEVARDGLFPFKPGAEVSIRVDQAGNQLIISKTGSSESY